MEQYIIDTNVISDYFSASLPADGMRFMGATIDTIPNLSVITHIELLCWNTDKATERKVENFISDSIVLDITTDVIKHCVSIRKHKKIKTPDAIIAATALANRLVLISHNFSDFKNISGLKVIDPWNL
ncbi:MAG: type II toxin-antitoxin system VapC family toxin [Bacteroidia bacterium]